MICAYLHAREYHKPSVCIIPFPIACFGVFLARSGILKDQSAHAYADGNIIVTGIIFFIMLGAALYLSFTKFRKQDDKRVKYSFSLHDKRLITYSLYAYAALVFFGTVAPIVLHIETPVAFYTAISVVFTIIYVTLLLVIGSIGSSALDREEVTMCNPDSSSVVISGIEIPMSSLLEKEMLIKSLPAEDIVIKCSEIVPLSQGGILIPYMRKPLIILFWIGSLLIIVQPVLSYIPRH